MERQIRLVIRGQEESVPAGMVGTHAVVLVARLLNRDPEGLVLRRVEDGFVIRTMAVGDVLRDGDAVELVPER